MTETEPGADAPMYATPDELDEVDPDRSLRDHPQGSLFLELSSRLRHLRRTNAEAAAIQRADALRAANARVYADAAKAFNRLSDAMGSAAESMKRFVDVYEGGQ